jgi:hypothetical protein
VKVIWGGLGLLALYHHHMVIFAFCAACYLLCGTRVTVQ